MENRLTNKKEWFNMLNDTCSKWERKGRDEVVMWFYGDDSWQQAKAAKADVESLGGKPFMLKLDHSGNKSFLLVEEPQMKEIKTTSNYPLGSQVIKTYTDDQGGRFIAVKKKLIMMLGLDVLVEGTSFYKGNTIYLDGNYDMERFMDAYQSAFRTRPKFINKHTSRAQIRSYTELAA